MQLLNYQHNILHIPGKDILLADDLSRVYLKDKLADEAVKTGSVNTIVDADLTEEQVMELVQHTAQDNQLASPITTVKEGWPEVRKDCPLTSHLSGTSGMKSL